MNEQEKANALNNMDKSTLLCDIDKSLYGELIGYISDAHKDAYGFRPHGQYNFNEMTLGELEYIADELSNAVNDTIEREAVEQRLSITEFEQRLTDLLSCGAKDRKAALKWLWDVEDDESMTNGYFEFINNLPYGYIEGV